MAGCATTTSFPRASSANIYKTCVDAGIDYMEVGYKADKDLFAGKGFGPWKYCEEEDIRREVGDNDTKLKLSPSWPTPAAPIPSDILPSSESVIDLIRVATYIHQIPAALELVHDAKQKGYEVALNLMAVSTVPDYELDNGLDVIAGVEEIDFLYVVDSFGSLLLRAGRRSDQPVYKKTGKTLGIHAHNNQQLAYANTIHAAINGVKMLDTTMLGMGRGAGNCYHRADGRLPQESEV
jgi:4-hydroxy 2-oxovalerate aldolase